ncbi:thiol-disulfide isomerase/thioredoxin [Kribbella sp. VKM Ac-2527]|uniref:Thiol-disulfide isomerase/thioredoxin n=1 Tax=Kribbella caucasensis TaxID=2512215 RepID=A0A4R6JJE0_9ACTN|nr:redoxin family protein [Kribbella sp. VKM Ac-2527]TDO36303.1 thiol-disulfide isomerase/thioredoxin [Kribbella sp. VKM Ac-2527]
MRISRPLLTAMTLLFVLLGTAACAADDRNVSPATGTSGATSAATPAPDRTSTASAGKLAFTGTTLDGKPFSAATLAGKPVLLWFWAPWCPTCHAEAPDVLSVQQVYAGRIGILGVAGLDDLNNMQPFVDRTMTAAITHLGDPDGAIWRRFEVTQQSTYVLLDAQGNVTFTGVIGGDELRDKVAALIG